MAETGLLAFPSKGFLARQSQLLSVIQSSRWKFRFDRHVQEPRFPRREDNTALLLSPLSPCAIMGKTPLWSGIFISRSIR